VVETFFLQEARFRAQRRKLSNRKVVLDEPKAMSVKATSMISDSRLERLRKYLEKEVKVLSSLSMSILIA
jgi:hypothetical protein